VDELKVFQIPFTWACFLFYRDDSCLSFSFP